MPQVTHNGKGGAHFLPIILPELRLSRYPLPPRQQFLLIMQNMIWEMTFFYHPHLLTRVHLLPRSMVFIILMPLYNGKVLVMAAVLQSSILKKTVVQVIL